jgi:uncharacterized membrane protein
MSPRAGDAGGDDRDGVDLAGADLDGAELAGADLRGSDMGGASGGESLASRASSVVGTATLVLGLAALAAGVDWFWMVFVVGWVVVTPAAEWAARQYESRAEESADGRTTDHAMADDETADALDELRDRYARSDIDEAEFERRVERLLETESVDDAESHYGGTDATVASDDGPRATEADRGRATETDRERETE